MTSQQTIVDISQAEQGTSLWHDAWLRLRRNRLAVLGLVVLVLFTAIALLTPWIAPYSYQAQNLELGASPPSAAHWLGTDIFGRDLLTTFVSFSMRTPFRSAVLPPSNVETVRGWAKNMASSAKNEGMGRNGRCPGSGASRTSTFHHPGPHR